MNDLAVSEIDNFLTKSVLDFAVFFIELSLELMSIIVRVYPVNITLVKLKRHEVLIPYGSGTSCLALIQVHCLLS